MRAGDAVYMNLRTFGKLVKKNAIKNYIMHISAKIRRNKKENYLP